MDPVNLFVPFSAIYLTTVLTSVVLIGLIALVGTRLNDKQTERQMRRGLAFLAIAIWIFYNAWWNWISLDLYNGLPLQICDLASLIAPLALLTLNRWLRAVLYFWGFGLSFVAFVQPTVSEGPAHLAFWMFWSVHTVIICLAVYDLMVGRFRPDWSDLWRACIASAGYLVFILPLNLILEANYGYVGNPPSGRKVPPLLEELGRWPERLAFIIILTLLVFLLLLLPWRLTCLKGKKVGRLFLP